MSSSIGVADRCQVWTHLISMPPSSMRYKPFVSFIAMLKRDPDILHKEDRTLWACMEFKGDHSGMGKGNHQEEESLAWRSRPNGPLERKK